MKNVAVIIHTIEDAEHCIINNHHIDKYVFSTNAAIDVYLNEKAGIACQCLSTYWNTEEIVVGRELISEKVDSILNKFDNESAKTINDNFNLDMNYYGPLYSYVGKQHYSIYYFVTESLNKIINKYNLCRIDLYDHPLNIFLNVDTNLSDLQGQYIKDCEVKIISYERKKYCTYGNILAKLQVIAKNPIFITNKIWKIIERNLRYRFGYQIKTKRTIILLEHLYNMSFLNRKLYDYNVLSYNPDNNSLIGIGAFNLLCQKHTADIRFIQQESKIFSNNKIDTFFINDIKQDFSKNIVKYLKTVLLIDSINQHTPICLGIWGNSPNQGMKALINEYIRSQKRPVIGAQHGGIYGDCYEPWHFDADFDRCDYFLSYGFTESDLKRLYPKKKIKTKILPFGCIMDFNKSKNKRKNIEILFPVTNSLSMIGAGMTRIPPNKMAQNQIAILQYLNSLNNITSYIKPFMLSNYDNCAVLPILERLKKLKIVDYMPLKMFIERYYPNLIIIEYPSTPLYETLHLDCEIFLLNNPVLPYEEKALELLRKRVHYFTEVDDMIGQIDLYLKGKVQKKRDDSFLNYYIKKPKSKENILSFIDKTIKAFKL